VIADRSAVEAGRAKSSRTIVPISSARPLELSILIVTWNSRRWIERCLASIPAACRGISYEVIVCDNASADTTLQELQKHRNDRDDTTIRFEVIQSARNEGFAGGMNRAFREARGRYVFLLNPDCELSEGSVSVLHEFLERNALAAAAAPLLADEGGVSQREFQFRRFPTLLTLASEVFAAGRFFPRNGVTARYHYRDLDLTAAQEVEQPAAAALLIRREVFEAVGPLDEQFAPAWFEDVDYCRRMAQQHHRLYVVPAASARHFGGASLEHLSFEAFTDAWYTNMGRYARKWFSPVRAEALRWLIVIAMAMRCGAALIGVAHPEVGRRRVLRTYASVMLKALGRWNVR
jgi:N-acetylglucosaminyl-diphospho-decaprenol L-rhamnosyltransferase